MSDRFTITQTPLQGLNVLERKPVGDSRGYLERMFCEDDLGELVAGKRVVQINQTHTAHQGAVRGMHFQNPPYAETKIVSCLAGEVFDVAIDLRAGSPTFLQWHGEVLSPGTHKSILIPEGFAHGFQALGDDCTMLYFHTAAYNQAAEGGVRATDPKLNIDWPLDITDMSDRDASHPLIDDTFIGIAV